MGYLFENCCFVIHGALWTLARINVTILLLAVFLSLRLPRDVCSLSETIYSLESILLLY